MSERAPVRQCAVVGYCFKAQQLFLTKYRMATATEPYSIPIRQRCTQLKLNERKSTSGDHAN